MTRRSMRVKRNPNDFVKLILYGALGIAGIKIMKDYQSAAPPEGGLAGQGSGLIADIGKWLFGTPAPEIDPVTGQPKIDPVTGKPVIPVGVRASECQIGESNVTWSRSANTLGGTVRIGHRGAGGPITIVLIPQAAPWWGAWVDKTPQIEAPAYVNDDADWVYQDLFLPHTHLDDWGTVLTGGGGQGWGLKYRMAIRDQNSMAVLCAQQYGDPIAID